MKGISFPGSPCQAMSPEHGMPAMEGHALKVMRYWLHCAI
jgi:hypothetical protein